MHAVRGVPGGALEERRAKAECRRLMDALARVLARTTQRARLQRAAQA